MLYINDWEKRQEKYKEYWARANEDRPLMSITAPKDNFRKRKIAASLKKEDIWLDESYIVQSMRAEMEATFYGGEAFPCINPNLGPDIFGATFGCDIVFEETTSYSVPSVTDWSHVPPLTFDQTNRWWQKLKHMTQLICEDAKGDYFVGITDLHPGMDGLVSIRGPENLCIDLYDEPEQVKTRVFEMFEVFKQQLECLYEITQKNLSGSTNWMGVWHPEKWYVTSCDFSCMVSEEMFDEFIKEELLAEINYLKGNSIYHLDGPGALKHLDALLDISNLTGIQWVYGAGQPTAAHWIPTLKKIQEAGKLIHINIVPQDLAPLLENLKPEGVMYNVEGKFTEEEAKNIMKLVQKSYKKNVY